MSFRELTMTDVREVLRRIQAGESARQMARAGVVDRKTAGRYIAAARACAVAPDTVLDDDVVGAVARRVQARPTPERSQAWQTLRTQRARIEQWLSGERPLRLVRVQELLAREGVAVTYTTLRRFARAELGWRQRKPSVRVQDAPFGEEAQADFGHVGYLDVEGKRRKLWALVVVLSASRHMFVWPLLDQTTEALCEGLDAAWRFFEGVPRRLVIDNTRAAVVKPDALAPTLQRAFVEYADARGFFVDPARVRRPQDKPRVENQIAYVRERCFDGERLPTLEEARTHAERWCREVAGRRVHGTTREVPLEVYERDEKPRMQPPPQSDFDVPAWSTVKVHPDHHVQVGRALYSVPTAYVGRQLQARADRTTLRLYDGTQLVKTHPRVAPGKRAVDPSDFPQGTHAYTERTIDGMLVEAKRRGENVARFVEQMLGVPMPWMRMRAAHALMRLCQRHGNERVDAACARALQYGVFDVRRIEGMLKSARPAEDEGVERGRLLQLPLGRFARDAQSFATVRSDDGGAR